MNGLVEGTKAGQQIGKLVDKYPVSENAKEWLVFCRSLQDFIDITECCAKDIIDSQTDSVAQEKVLIRDD